jgi:hypothetical protein
MYVSKYEMCLDNAFLRIWRGRWGGLAFPIETSMLGTCTGLGCTVDAPPSMQPRLSESPFVEIQFAVSRNTELQ